jgi:threonine aldolase
MRQAGVLAAAALKGIDDFESGLLEADHAKARHIAKELGNIPGLDVDVMDVHTNMVLVHLEYEEMAASNNPSFFTTKLKEHGLLVLPFGPRTIRLVTHRY